MSEQVTLNIPDHIYRRAKLMAEESGQPLTEVLTDMLQRAFPPYHVSRGRQRMELEEAEFTKRLPVLQQEYAGQYVALKDGAVIDSDADRIALVSRVAAAYPQDLVTIKLVTTEPLRTLRAPTPRLRSS